MDSHFHRLVCLSGLQYSCHKNPSPCSVVGSHRSVFRRLRAQLFLFYHPGGATRKPIRRLFRAMLFAISKITLGRTVNTCIRILSGFIPRSKFIRGFRKLGDEISEEIRGRRFSDCQVRLKGTPYSSREFRFSRITGEIDRVGIALRLQVAPDWIANTGWAFMCVRSSC